MEKNTMYKYKNNKSRNWSCCPMGTMRDGTVVECYYYGIITLKECSECEVRNDTRIVKKIEK